MHLGTRTSSLNFRTHPDSGHRIHFLYSCFNGPIDLDPVLNIPQPAPLSGGATPGRARSNDLAGRSTALPQALAPPCPSPAYCFASVIVWTENNKRYHIWPLYLFYFDSETALAACILRVTTKKGRQLFWGKKVHPGDLAGGFSDLEMTWLLYCAGAATGQQFTKCILYSAIVCWEF